MTQHEAGDRHCCRRPALPCAAGEQEGRAVLVGHHLVQVNDDVQQAVEHGLGGGPVVPKRQAVVAEIGSIGGDALRDIQSGGDVREIDVGDRVTVRVPDVDMACFYRGLELVFHRLQGEDRCKNTTSRRSGCTHLVAVSVAAVGRNRRLDPVLLSPRVPLALDLHGQVIAQVDPHEAGVARLQAGQFAEDQTEPSAGGMSAAVDGPAEHTAEVSNPHFVRRAKMVGDEVVVTHLREDVDKSPWIWIFCSKKIILLKLCDGRWLNDVNSSV